MSFELIQVISIFSLYAGAIFMALACGPLFKVDEAESGERNRTLDGMRALAAVGVAASHINQYVCAYAGTSGVPHIGNHVGIIGVQMFFALTAYLFTDRVLRAKIEPVPFLLGRIRRIIPLYTFAVFAAILIAAFYTSGIQANFAQTAKETFKIYTYGFWVHHAISFKGFNMLRLLCVAWTLSYEWAFYLLLIPAAKIWNKSRIATGVLMLAALALIFLQFANKSEQVIWPFFLPGVLAAVFSFYLPKPPDTVRKLLPIASLTFLYLMLTTEGYWTAVKLMCSTGLFLSVFYGRAPLLSWKPLQTLATISFSIYLLQYLLICPVSLYINHNPAIFSNSVSKVASIFCVMLALIPLSFCTYVLIERPFMTRRKQRAVVSNAATGEVETERELVSSVR
ncbi:MAG TPA: acyltransferase [Candidatus Melainabacteria bacterium]|nr:acyltransferase [Candidatus Melainabacteria bacterium]